MGNSFATHLGRGEMRVERGLLRIINQDDARNALVTFDHTLSKVALALGSVGAFQKRLLFFK